MLPGRLPLILHEFERSKWHSSSCCKARFVVGDLQHPLTTGALLERWEVFPDLIDAPYAITTGSTPLHQPRLPCWPWGIVSPRGFHPFPRAISIPDDFRSVHLNAIADPDLLENPLPGLYQAIADPYEAAKQEMSLSAEEIDSGEYEAEHVEGLILAAREAVTADAETGLPLPTSRPSSRRIRSSSRCRSGRIPQQRICWRSVCC